MDLTVHLRMLICWYFLIHLLTPDGLVSKGYAFVAKRLAPQGDTLFRLGVLKWKRYLDVTVKKLWWIKI